MRRLVPPLFIVAAVAAGTASATSAGLFDDVSFSTSDIDLIACEASSVHAIPADPILTAAATQPLDLVGQDLDPFNFGVAGVTLDGLTCGTQDRLADITLRSLTSGVLLGTPGCDYTTTDLATPTFSTVAACPSPAPATVTDPVTSTVYTVTAVTETCDGLPGACALSGVAATVMTTQTGLAVSPLGVVSFPEFIDISIADIQEIEFVIYDVP